MRFVQFADVHLDSRITGALNLPEDKAAMLRQDIRASFCRACDLAVENRADIVLIPGDLFDYETSDDDTGAFLAGAFEKLSPIRVFIAPGNHDSLRPRNPYLSGVKWPENVHIFTSPEFETVILDDLDCAVTGIAHAHRGITDRMLATPIEREERSVNILLFHGSRDGYRPSEKENVIPFSDEELLAQGFTYVAIGHYHSFAEIRDKEGRVRAAYSGCPQGRGLDETGRKWALIGEIDPRGGVTLDRIEVAARRIMSAEVDVTGLASAGAVSERLDAALASAGVRECDVARAAFRGLLFPAVVIDPAEMESTWSCFHMSVDLSRVEPEYDIDALARDSTASSVRSAYVKRILEMREHAGSRDDALALHDALYYGLYALDGRKVEARNAD